MRKALIAFASLAALAALPGAAMAQDAGAAGAATGAATGAITGAVIGGPIGAAVGAVAGGAIGGAAGTAAEQPAYPPGYYAPGYVVTQPAPVYVAPPPEREVIVRRRIERTEPTATVGCRAVTVRRYNDVGDLVVRRIRRCD